MFVAVGATILSIVSSVLAAYAIVRLRYKGAQWVGARFSRLSGAAVDPVHSAILGRVPIRTVRHAVRADHDLSDNPDPLLDLAADGLFQDDSPRLEECALIDGASRWQILTKIVLPLAVPGLISAFIFCFTLCWNEFIYALTFLSTTSQKTVPVAIVNEFVDGDIYRWGSLMAGALAGSLPLVVLRIRRALCLGHDRRGEGIKPDCVRRLPPV